MHDKTPTNWPKADSETRKTRNAGRNDSDHPYRVVLELPDLPEQGDSTALLAEISGFPIA